MFEDDLDIDFDEVLNYSQSTNSNLKRQNIEGSIEDSNKKAKHSNLELHTSDKNLSSNLGNDSSLINPSHSTGVTKPSNQLNKTFHFRKVTTNLSSVQNEFKSSLPNCINENNALASINLNFKSTTGMTKLNQKINKNVVSPFSDKIHFKNISSDISITKRRFPGPAGLLPERCSESTDIEESDKSVHSETKEEICSQSSCLVLNEGPWQKMRIEFLPKSPEEIYLPDKYNIQWIKSRVLMKKLINQKAPFLAAFVHRITSHSIQNPIVNLILKDETGTIHGTILHNLYEEYSNELIVGAVIVLKEVGVLNTGSKTEPYLTITSNNLMSIYTTLQKGDSSNNQKSKIIVRNISASDICSNIGELKRLHKVEMEKLKNIQKIPSVSSEISKPSNPCNNFKKAVNNLSSNQQKNQLQPNLHNLRTISVRNNSNIEHKTNFITPDKTKFDYVVRPIKTSNIISNNTEDIDDIMDLFNTQEELDEFFNEEPNFSSTQISHNNGAKPDFTTKSDIHTKIGCVKPNFHVTVSKNNEIEDRVVLQDMLEGLDTDALFDDF